MDRPPSRSRAPLSLEALIDEENREVLAAMDRSKRSASPLPKVAHARTATPPPPIRSMLDVDDFTPRHGSIAGIGVGITSPRRSSRLDPADPSTYTSPHSSKPNSPVLSKAVPVSTRQRGSSDADRPTGLPKIQPDDKRDFEQNYQFDIASIPSSAALRSPAEGKRPREGSSPSMAAAMSGDFSNLYVAKPKGAGNQTSTAAHHSRSASSPTMSSRSDLLSPPSPRGHLLLDPRNSAESQASNKSDSFSTVNDDSEGPSGRVPRDGPIEEDAVESSDEEVDSSDEDETTRGRPERRPNSTEDPQIIAQALSKDKENESTATPPVKSLLEPSISITSPSGESMSEQKPEHKPEQKPEQKPEPYAPSTTSVEDEDEDWAAIQKAKRLAINISPVDSSVANRDCRVILRGDWLGCKKKAEAGRRSSRLYLVCSDLSVEASYAMEWVVGTMLRDGDTILAMHAIEDESAGKASEEQRDALTAEGARAGQETADVMETLTRQTTQGGGISAGLSAKNKYIPATEAESLSGSVDARKTSKKQMERLRAVDSVIENFLKLVRKTPLEVRCTVEVIHCKSPKHLILGAIDALEPTLCVVGTRGRSSLKGVLLGSFSNYLVTKSSVPVMVARRRLKKPRSDVKISSTKIRLSNNLSATHIPTKRRSLTQARID
ncbi:hypothetical protein PV08_09446 [Exophiala spinifera]|uniref:UspA domain-containing protein n=1 Tax=Exophiala spinifera TaxID=91928 RepID=A0A0D1YB67_9EURO|nr:uncharacterized protein PV08_09446 [Exophiala spinifera]KIW12171.1 hypothetical protein PV08_09446 [Exophiala spinifera]